MKPLLTIASALLISVSFASAADAEANQNEKFTKFDTNGDGFISLDEMRARPMIAPVEEVFKRLDTDNDGKLSMGEFSATASRRTNSGR
jgi:Ca2+-binding EF-hand superfamily protein